MFHITSRDSRLFDAFVVSVNSSLVFLKLAVRWKNQHYSSVNTDTVTVSVRMLRCTFLGPCCKC